MEKILRIWNDFVFEYWVGWFHNKIFADYFNEITMSFRIQKVQQGDMQATQRQHTSNM
jgi:hypothetical protein